jgi:3-oxoacyl-[acyl-carrier-protein] synthase-1/3-oxoacyl-[acyl-carrier-protein] synthase II
MPINANLTERDVDCDLNFVVGSPRRARIRVAMSNSFGFGGSNSCVVVRNPADVDGIAGSGG